MRLELIKNNKFNLTDEPILFLENFLKKLSYEFLSYYNDFEENPFIYRERTLSSIIFPALMKSSRRAAMELYYNNKHRNFLDYYALDEMGENSYLIEVKHLFYDNKECFGTYHLKKWEQLNEQFYKLCNNKKSIEEYIDSEKNIFAISLGIVVPWFLDEKEVKDIEYYSEKIKNDLKPDWIFLYELKDSKLYQIEKIYMPWVIFIGKIKEI